MTHGSLFSGIGGFDLAAEWMGWENKFHCEWNEFGKRVLKYYWPEADSHDDITKTDFTKYNGTVELISGGFPCQPYSSAGKRLGKADDRHLWPHMLRAIKEVAPRWVVGENVRGLTNWNGGLVFDEVCADLENLGYQVAPYLIPACGVNAPHRRERIWFVAHSRHNSKRKTGSCTNDEGSELTTLHTKGQRRERQTIFNSGLCDLQGNASDTECIGLQCEGQSAELEGKRFSEYNAQNNVQHTYGIGQECRMHSQQSENAISELVSKSNAWFNQRESWHNFPTQSPICSGDDGISNQLDGITFSKWRNESIKAYGNAVVPQVVYQIFKAIEQYEATQHNPATGHR